MTFLLCVKSTNESTSINTPFLYTEKYNNSKYVIFRYLIVRNKYHNQLLFTALSIRDEVIVDAPIADLCATLDYLRQTNLHLHLALFITNIYLLRWIPRSNVIIA